MMIESNKLYCEDCIDTMKKINDNSIDMVITSPPYDKLREYNGYKFNFKKTAIELFRVIKEGGVIVWIVSDQTINGSESCTSFKQVLYFKEIGLNIHDTMIYMKDNPPPVGGSNRYYQSFEYCFILTKGKIKTFNPIVEKRRNKYNDNRTTRLRPVTRNKSGIFIEKQVNVKEYVKLQNIWSYTVSGGSVATDKFAHNHPAIFPESLCRDHIISWSNENDIVYDPFMGSGTTAKVCILNNRKWIGSEISKEYCKISEDRINEIQS